MNYEQMTFEPLGNIGGGGRNSVPQLYQSASQNMGFLTLQGSEILVPLDGQHRTKAFKFAMDGADDNNRPIQGIKANQELAKDEVAVILVRFQPDQARRIFNKINRYAKATSRSDNLIIDDDDALAVISRNLLGDDGVIPSRLVRIGANTLTANAPEFTTLSTFYDSNEAIISGLKIVGKGSVKQMPVDQRTIVEGQVKEEWRRLLNQVDLWSCCLSDPTESGDQTRIQIREQTLLGKPIGQLSLVRGYMLMRDKCAGIPEDALCGRLNRIDWDVKAPMWRGVLMNLNERVMSGRGTVNRACEFIAHLGGAELNDEERQRLLEHIHGSEWEQHELPASVS
jgi:DNA sulfur modification protein DndB